MLRFNRLLKALGIAEKKAEPILEKTRTLIPEEKSIGMEALKAEDKALTEKARLKYLKDQGITEGSLDQILKAPFTIKDREQREFWTKWHKDATERNKVLEAQEKDPIWQRTKENIKESKKARGLSSFKDWSPKGPTTQEMKERRLQELELQRQEGVRDIDLRPFWESLSTPKKAAGLAAAATGASALSPDEAEAGYPGSAAANKKISELMDRTLENWIVHQSPKAREALQKQFELDPTGAAQKEALRRLSARTDVRKNPVTGEHEFKLYRGDTENRFSGSPQSFTTDPNIAGEFAELYGGKVNEVWVPASSIGSIPGLLKEGQYLSSEKEVITKPFKAESTPYVPKEPTLHERISKRGAKKSEEETDDYISEMLSEGSSKKAAGLAATGGIGAAALSGGQAQASQGPTISQSNPEFANAISEEEYKKKEKSDPYTEEKSKLLKALEGYGTAARSGFSSATLGLSEPVISGLSAGIGNIVSSGLEAESPLDFAKKAVDLERLKKEYERDIDYRKQMQEEHPGADIAGSLGGAFLPVGPAAAVAGAIGKGTAKLGKAAYEAGALKAASKLVGEKAARAGIKTGLAGLEGAAFIPAVSMPEEKILEATGFSPEEDSSALEQALTGARIQGSVKGGIEGFKAIRKLLRR